MAGLVSLRESLFEWFEVVSLARQFEVFEATGGNSAVQSGLTPCCGQVGRGGGGGWGSCSSRSIATFRKTASD